MSSEDNLRELISKRSSIKGRVTKFKNNLDTLDTSSQIELNKLALKLPKHEALFIEFDELQTQIEILNVDNLDAELTSRELIEQDFYHGIAFAKTLLEKNGSTQVPASQHTSEHSCCQTGHNYQNPLGFRLPEIRIPNFDGTCYKWLEFKDIFTSLIHDNDKIKKIHKFHYLSSYLQGEAARVISNLEIADQNYGDAWKILCERYDNKRQLINNHLKSLLNLDSVRETEKSLRFMIDHITKNLRALNSLGLPTDKWDVLIIHLLSGKLDNTTHLKWEEHRNVLPDIPTLEHFFSFLKSRADVLETSAHRSRQEKPKYNPVLNPKGQTKVLVGTSSIVDKIQSHSSTALPSWSRCVVCKDNHRLHQCSYFKDKHVEERNRIVESHNLCPNCLRGGHMSSQCKLPGSCKTCKKRHNSMLCKSIEPANENAVETMALSAISSTEVLLCTAIVQVTNPNTNDTASVRALLDSGSQSTFITEAVKQRLNLTTQPTNTEIVGIGNNPLKLNTERCSVQVQSKDKTFNVAMSCLILPTISGKVPKVALDISHLNLSQFNLADPKFNESAPIDMLIGADLFWDLIGADQHSLGVKNPILRSSKLGWLIAGPIFTPKPNLPTSKRVMCNFALNKEAQPNRLDLDHELAKFWDLESLPQRKALTSEEKLCEQHFLANTTRTSDGRFCVALPLRGDPSLLGNTYNLAKTRLLSLEARFRKQPEVKKAYTDFIHEYEALGHLNKLTTEPTKNSYFLPHHPVIKESSESTKTRVVFEACAQASSSSPSVNDLQMIGPTIQDPLFNILVRFRQHRFVITGDIEKMFRAVVVRESDRPLQQILWRDNENDPIQILQLNTVTYGFASASYLATRCIFQVGQECYDPIIKNIIQSDFYCDDLLTGANAESELRYIQQSVSRELAKYGFHLRKYRTNLPNPLFTDPVDLDDNLMISNATSTLGVGWNPSSDEFQFPIQYSPPKVLTKRSILSSTFKIFDPLGLLCLCTIKPKIIIQDLFRLKLDWDESPVPEHIEKSWFKFTDHLSELSSVKIPRFALINDATLIELHVFNDASMQAYGSCVYLRSLDAKQNVRVSLLCAKSRVAPIKATTIPRLELCAALLGAQLNNTVIQALRCPISRQVYWTDSTVVLGWLRVPNKTKTFVANRVAAITDLTDPTCWRHVPTDQNPADLVSRGVDPNQVHSSLWWHGPKFLSQPESHWPTEPSSLSVDLPEMKAFPTFVGEGAPQCKTILIKIDNYSNLLFMQGVVAYILRFIYNLKNPTDKLLGTLSVDERNQAMTHLIKMSQTESFEKEVVLLLNNKPLKSQVSLTSLNPFLDSNGVLRVGGRIDSSFYSYDKKHPIVLKSDNHLTKLLFQHEHRRLFHAGPQAVLASIRDRYWPIGGRNLARRVYRQCFTCRRFRGKAMTQIMGSLPAERVEPDYPFHTVGTDFAGPFLITDRKGRGCKITKCYLCVFVCFRYKCIHLEVVSDLTKEAFILTLKRFIGRRGLPKIIYCDNGRNFVAAAKDIKQFFKLNNNSITGFAASQGIEFRFSPAYAPHFGGLWEAGVKSAKGLLAKVLNSTHLTFEELTSLFTQIEAILNSRPLCPLSTSPNDFAPLTPGHFLIGRPLTALPTSSLLEDNSNRLNRYQLLERARQHFWQRWSKEYIAEVQQRTKWRAQTAPLNLNDLVLIKDDATPPLCWSLGRVTKLFYGSDNVPRVAEVSTARGPVRRALNRLCLLPTKDES